MRHKHSFKPWKSRKSIANDLPYLLIPYRNKTYYIKGKQLHIYDRAIRDIKQLEDYVISFSNDPIPEKISIYNGIKAVMVQARKNLTKTRQVQIEKYFFENYT